MNPAGVIPENDYAGEGQQQLQTTGRSYREKGCYMRTIAASVQLENQITGRDSQGSCLIGGKPSVVKQL
jgi:hypothetical protein